MQNFSKFSLNDESEDCDLWKVVIAQQEQVLYWFEPCEHFGGDGVLSLADGLASDSFFELEGEASPDVLDDPRSAALLSFLLVWNEVVVELVDEEHNAASESHWL